MDPNIKKRFAWFVWACAGVIPIMSWGYSVLGFAFAIFPRDYQWILGLLSPTVRELLIFMLQESVYRGAEEGARGQYSIRLTSCYYMEMRHAIFLAIILGSIATPITCYCVIGIRIASFLIQYSHASLDMLLWGVSMQKVFKIMKKSWSIILLQNCFTK